VNTAASRVTWPFSSNDSLPNVHCHSPELQGHLQVINDRRTRRLRREMPAPPVNPPPSRRPTPPMRSLCRFLARRTPLMSLVQVVKTFFPLGHRQTTGERATVWPTSTVTTLGGHRSVWVAGPWVDCQDGPLWPFGLAGTMGRWTSGTLSSGQIRPSSA
jgi:hypothetical protein